ncbi:TRAP transporter small permease [bacterium]|nr:TRAP transporter small permease [bacterium]
MLKRLIEALSKIINPISSNLDKISWLVLFCMMIYTVVDVLALKVVSYSLLGTVEMTALMMVICVFCSFSQTELEDGHIRVDFIYNKLNKRLQALCDVITQLTCTILFGFIGWSSFLNAIEKWETSEVTMDLLLPLFPFAFIVSVGCVLTCITLLVKTLKALDRMVSP